MLVLSLTDSSELSVTVQERLLMSILPRFLVLEMISDMAVMDEYLLPQQFHKVYIHHYKDVRSEKQ